MRPKSLLSAALLPLLLPGGAWAQAQRGTALVLPQVQLGFGPPTTPAEVATGLQILALLTVLTLAPSILVMMTSFTRIVIVLAFMRQALGMQQTPPNPVLIGMALFLTFFSMAPVGTVIHKEALQPYMSDEIDYMTALRRAGGATRPGAVPPSRGGGRGPTAPRSPASAGRSCRERRTKSARSFSRVWWSMNLRRGSSARRRAVR